MKRQSIRAIIAASAASVVLAACSIPRQLEDTGPSKVAASEEEVEEVFERYAEVRATAVRVLDAKVLSIIEAGPALAIDAGSFEVAERLKQRRSTEPDDRSIDVDSVATPRFGRYPLWFMAVVRDPEREVNRVQIFERSRAADPWLLVASPETVLDSELPALRQRYGSPIQVGPDSETAMSMSPQRAADTYAQVLEEPDSKQAGLFQADAFRKQMRAATEQNRNLRRVRYSQKWAADPVRYALRLRDGGALVFVDLKRADTYRVPSGVTVTWPKDSPQRAFIPAGISTSGTLVYRHQVLMIIPGRDRPVRVIGQYGGVVGAQGF